MKLRVLTAPIFDKSHVLTLHRFSVVFLSSVYYNYSLLCLGDILLVLLYLCYKFPGTYCPVYFDLPPLSTQSWSSVIITSAIGRMDLLQPIINGKPVWQATLSLLLFLLCSFSQGFHVCHICTSFSVCP